MIIQKFCSDCVNVQLEQNNVKKSNKSVIFSLVYFILGILMFMAIPAYIFGEPIGSKQQIPNMPTKYYTAKTYVSQLFNVEDFCWNAAGADDPNAPLWKSCYADLGYEALREIRNIIKEGSKAEALEVAGLHSEVNSRKIIERYYVLQSVLRNPPRWLDLGQIELFREQLVDSMAKKGIPEEDAELEFNYLIRQYEKEYTMH